MIVLQTIAEPRTAADGGPAVLRGSVVLSQVGCSAAPAAELARYRAKKSLASLAACKSLSGKG
jgi:hypothetical protein